MPQLSQLSDVILSQLFWLLLVLGFIYFVIGRGMVPKIQSTVDRRDRQIADDLAAAEAAKAAADQTEEAYRQRMDESRVDAMKRTAAAKQQGVLATEQRIAVAAEAIDAKLSKAADAIRASRKEAVAHIAEVATQLTRDIAARVAGVTIDADDAAKAVKAALSNG